MTCGMQEKVLSKKGTKSFLKFHSGSSHGCWGRFTPINIYTCTIQELTFFLLAYGKITCNIGPCVLQRWNEDVLGSFIMKIGFGRTAILPMDGMFDSISTIF